MQSAKFELAINYVLDPFLRQLISRSVNRLLEVRILSAQAGRTPFYGDLNVIPPYIVPGSG
jgi:hypothetical protein